MPQRQREEASAELRVMIPPSWEKRLRKKCGSRVWAEFIRSILAERIDDDPARPLSEVIQGRPRKDES